MILSGSQYRSRNIDIANLVISLRHCCGSGTSTTGNNQLFQSNKCIQGNNAFHRTSGILNSSCLILNDPVRRLSIIQELPNQTLDCIDASDKDLYDILARDMTVKTEFISEEEENSLLNEVEKYISRLRYKFDHWDNAIHGFRETENKSWNENNAKIIKRVQSLAFGTQFVPLPFVHVLDISKKGYIKPHVDAVRFCGDTIAGMCLLSSCVMRLALETDSSKYGDVYLPRRSLYIMKNRARYEFTHEVLKEEASVFRNQTIPRERRISIICRCEPNPADTT
jgi:alkylated DNA repair protein alkB family protein 7